MTTRQSSWPETLFQRCRWFEHRWARSLPERTSCRSPLRSELAVFIKTFHFLKRLHQTSLRCQASSGISKIVMKFIKILRVWAFPWISCFAYSFPPQKHSLPAYVWLLDIDLICGSRSGVRGHRAGPVNFCTANLGKHFFMKLALCTHGLLWCWNRKKPSLLPRHKIWKETYFLEYNYMILNSPWLGLRTEDVRRCEEGMWWHSEALVSPDLFCIHLVSSKNVKLLD